MDLMDKRTSTDWALEHYLASIHHDGHNVPLTNVEKLTIRFANGDELYLALTNQWTRRELRLYVGPQDHSVDDATVFTGFGLQIPQRTLSKLAATVIQARPDQLFKRLLEPDIESFELTYQDGKVDYVLFEQSLIQIGEGYNLGAQFGVTDKALITLSELPTTLPLWMIILDLQYNDRYSRYAEKIDQYPDLAAISAYHDTVGMLKTLYQHLWPIIKPGGELTTPSGLVEITEQNTGDYHYGYPWEAWSLMPSEGPWDPEIYTPKELLSLRIHARMDVRYLDKLAWFFGKLILVDLKGVSQ